jgi:hypothetical protein
MKTSQQLSQEAIEQFKTNYWEEFGKTLSDDEVREIAIRLLHFLSTLSFHRHDKTAASPVHDGSSKNKNEN